jgi:hypothetical protein
VERLVVSDKQHIGQPGSGNDHLTPAKQGLRVTFVLSIVLLLLLALISSGFYFVTHMSSRLIATITNSVPGGTTSRQTVGSQVTPQALFADDFADNDNNWDTTSGSGYTRDISNNVLTLADANHKILIETLPTDNTYGDLVATVTFTLVQADRDDSVGLYVRGDSNLDHDYRLDLFGDGSYAVSKEYLDGTEVKLKPIVEPTKTSALKLVGEDNTVSLIAKGSKFVLVINNQVVSSFTDTDYTDGQVALFVQNGDASKGVKATFSSVAIYPAPTTLPG